MDPEFARFQAYHLVIDDRKEYNNKYKKTSFSFVTKGRHRTWVR